MNRLIYLDILRAAAVCLVLVRHLAICPGETSLVVRRIQEYWHRGGWVGVDLFFVLSGFLISGLLFREFKKYGSIDCGRFLIRRGFKIYPSFWLMVGITYILYTLDDNPNRRYTVFELVFIQNYFPGVWGHTWTLAIEEHFYIILPLLLIVIYKTARSVGNSNPFWVTPYIFIALALVCLALRIENSLSREFTYLTHLRPTHLRIDSLFFGVFISYYANFHSTQFIRIAQRFAMRFILIGCLLLVPAFIYELEQAWMISTFGFSVFYLGSGMILVGMFGCKPFESRRWSFIALVGRQSYSIYLWHYMYRYLLILYIFPFFGMSWFNDWFAYALVYFVGSLLIGIGLGRLIEAPMLRFRERYYPSRRREG